MTAFMSWLYFVKHTERKTLVPLLFYQFCMRAEGNTKDGEWRQSSGNIYYNLKKTKTFCHFFEDLDALRDFIC